MNKVITYAKSIIVPLLIGGLVGVITSKYIDYTSLSQPSWAPRGTLCNVPLFYRIGEKKSVSKAPFSY